MEDRRFREIVSRCALRSGEAKYELIIALLYVYYLKHFDGSETFLEQAEKIIAKEVDSNDLCADVFEIIDKEPMNDSEFKLFVKEFSEYFMTSIEHRTLSLKKELNNICKEIMRVSEGDVVLDESFNMGRNTILLYNQLKKFDNLTFKTIELIPDRVAATNMYYQILGIKADVITGDSLNEEKPLRYTKALVFPQFNMAYPNAESFIEKRRPTVRSRKHYEWMYVLRTLDDLPKDGKVVAIMSPSALYSGPSTEIRKYLIENNLIEGVVKLPANAINGTSIESALIVFSHGNKEIKIIDASEMTVGSSARFGIRLDERRITDAYWHHYKRIGIQEVCSNNYELSPSSYLAERIDVPYATRLGDVCEVINGSQYTLSRFKDVISEEKTNYQLLIPGDIVDGEIDYKSLVNIEPDEKWLKFELKENDIVVTSKSTRIKFYLINGIPKNQHIIVGGGITIIRADPAKIDPEFLHIFLNSGKGTRLVNRASRGTTIKIVSPRELLDLTISCPPASEQEECVKKYNMLLISYKAVRSQMKNLESRIASFYDDYLGEDV